jgi:hypothetical protein
MVEAKNVCHTMHNEGEEPFMERDRQRFRFLTGFFNGDYNVSYDFRRQSIHVGKGYNICGIVLAKKLFVKFPDSFVINKEDTEIPILQL